jgi:hypothetical protein
MKSQKEVFVTMVRGAWDVHNERVTKLIESLSEEQLMAETAPGRNRGIYLLGHLVAVNDRLFTLLGFGDRLYPQLDETFVTKADRSADQLPSLNELKKNWRTVNERLSEYFEKMTADEWFERHTSVSAEDFSKEPHRNKLNVLINRTNHTSYHLGQLIYLAKK